MSVLQTLLPFLRAEIHHDRQYPGTEDPYQKKYEVVQAVEAVNDFYKGSGKNLLLMTPGRVGTSSPELGVRLLSQYFQFSAVCEVSDSWAGYMPELSYGSHMFQDLVEAQILYGAVYNDRRTLTYHAELFGDIPDRFMQICPDCPELAGMLLVREVTDLFFWLDAVSNHAICGYKKTNKALDKIAKTVYSLLYKFNTLK